MISGSALAASNHPLLISPTITNFVTFNTNATKSATHSKMLHIPSKTNHSKHFHFSRLLRPWNSLPPIDLEAYIITTIEKLRDLFYNHFIISFDSSNLVLISFTVPAPKIPIHHYLSFNYILLKGGAIPETNEIVTLICSCHNFFSLSSVQILFIPACCLLCVL